MAVDVEHLHHITASIASPPETPCANSMPGSNPTPPRSRWLTSALCVLLMLDGDGDVSRPGNRRYWRAQVVIRAAKPSSDTSAFLQAKGATCSADPCGHGSPQTVDP